MNRGFIILAQNTEKVNYVKCAEVLAKSIKRAMPDESITLISNDVSMCNAFDNVVELPYGDLAPDSDWKLINDWQVYEASPYEYTIKLEADMFIPYSISHWWEVLSQRDVVICDTIRNFKGDISGSRVYRKFIDDNKLPNCYNAITYADEVATTDWAYAIACHIMGIENTMLPGYISMTHMKQFVNETPSEDWTSTLLFECLSDKLRVNTYTQMYPFHYHVKSFADILMEKYK
jgi:hypothetical protein